MALNLITNQTASIAHRNLVQSDMDMTKSLSKLSSGQRVVSAKDDAASMAIGSRIKADVQALRQIQVNSTQAISMLQVAEGAHARIYDMLVRLKSLASQAGSSSLSNTERGMLDTEYQTLLSEIDRTAASTTFNNTQLVNANVTAGQSNNFWSNAIDIGIGGVATSTASIAVNANFTNSNGVYYITASAGGRAYVGIINSNQINTSNGTLTSGASIRLVPSSATTYGASSGDNSYITVSFGSGVNVTTSLAGGTGSSFGSSAGSTSTSLSFKVGIGSNPVDNQITLNMSGVNSTALGIVNSNILTQNYAESAYASIGNAIDLLLTFRADVGAGQSRMESTSANVSIVIENMEAARSAYLDLDVAQEMANFTNKQILQQAGVAMIAQANQLPQNLLRLFQQ